MAWGEAFQKVFPSAGSWTVVLRSPSSLSLKQIGEEKLCIAFDADNAPDADALAGPEGQDCVYKDKLVRKGRLIATLSCKAGAGVSELVVEGNYTNDSMTLGTTMTKTEGGKPVLRTTHDLTARRVGDCPKAG